MGGRCDHADPPTHPTVMNVRYLPEEQLPKGTRTFKPEKNHKTWGNRIQPLGCWRITPTTRTVIVLEGLFDLLITAQKIHQLGRDADTVAVYTNGASPAAKLHRWFREHGQYEYVLMRDPDPAGVEWALALSSSIRSGGASVRTVPTPGPTRPGRSHPERMVAVRNLNFTLTQSGSDHRSPIFFSTRRTLMSALTLIAILIGVPVRALGTLVRD